MEDRAFGSACQGEGHDVVDPEIREPGLRTSPRRNIPARMKMAA